MYLCCVFSTAGMDLRGCTPVPTSDCAVDQCWSIGVASLFTVIVAFKTAVCGCCSVLILVSTSCWWLVLVYNCYCHHPQPLWPPRQLCVVAHLNSSWCPPLCAVDQCWGSLSMDIIAFKTALCGCSPLCCWPVLTFVVLRLYSLQDSFVWSLTSVLLTSVDIDQRWHVTVALTVHSQRGLHLWDRPVRLDPGQERWLWLDLSHGYNSNLRYRTHQRPHAGHQGRYVRGWKQTVPSLLERAVKLSELGAQEMALSL